MINDQCKNCKAFEAERNELLLRIDQLQAENDELEMKLLKCYEGYEKDDKAPPLTDYQKWLIFLN